MTCDAQWYRNAVRRAKLAGVPRSDRTLIRCELLADLLDAGHLELTDEPGPSFFGVEFDALARATSARDPMHLRESIARGVDEYREHGVLPAVELAEPNPWASIRPSP